MSAEEVLICSVGDLMICDSPLYVSVGVGSHYKDIRSKLIGECKKQFEGADLVIGNLETVVYDSRNNSLEEMQMCCQKGAIEDLHSIGFNILNIANNHIMQHGEQAVRETVSACEANKIMCIGEKRGNPRIIDIKGIQIAFFSLCIHLEWYQPENILYETNIIEVLKQVSNLRRRNSNIKIIVLVHWGDEFASYPSNAQVELAHELVDCGSDVILGHHSHVFQGIEEYGDAVIAYGQGNYISDMMPCMCKESGVLYIRIPVNGRKIQYTFQSIAIGDDFIPRVSDGTWITNRNSELDEVLSQKISDDDYWAMITKNHRVGHADFRRYFISNVLKYRLRIGIMMILGFIYRKAKRLVGSSTDGRVSSMDSEIREAVSIMKQRK